MLEKIAVAVVTHLSYKRVTIAIGYAEIPRPRLTDDQKAISRQRRNALTRARMARYRQRLAEQHRRFAERRLFDPYASDEERAADLRQSVTASLHTALDHAVSGAYQTPIFLKEAFEREPWKGKRLSAGRMGYFPPSSFYEYIYAKYPLGLGSDYATVRRFIAHDSELCALFGAVAASSPPPPSSRRSRRRSGS